MAAVTKADLVQHLFTVMGINKREAKEVVDLFFAEISTALVQGNLVKLPEFGVFRPKMAPAREGRNPKTGEKVAIAAHRTAAFKAADLLKEKIQIYGESTDSETN